MFILFRSGAKLQVSDIIGKRVICEMRNRVEEMRSLKGTITVKDDEENPIGIINIEDISFVGEEPLN